MSTSARALRRNLWQQVALIAKTVLDAKAAGDTARKMCTGLLQGKSMMENLQKPEPYVMEVFRSLAASRDCLQVMEEATLSSEDQACKHQLEEALTAFKGAIPAASASYEELRPAFYTGPWFLQGRGCDLGDQTS